MISEVASGRLRRGQARSASKGSDPVERALFSRLPYQQVTSHVSLSLQGVASMGLVYVIPYRQQPWEVEAHFLAKGSTS